MKTQGRRWRDGRSLGVDDAVVWVELNLPLRYRKRIK